MIDHRSLGEREPHTAIIVSMIFSFVFGFALGVALAPLFNG